MTNNYCSLHFIQALSIVPLQVHYYSQALSTQHGYCAGVSRQSTTGNLLKVPMRRLQLDFNLQPFGWKSLNLPTCHHATQMSLRLLIIKIYIALLQNKIESSNIGSQSIGLNIMAMTSKGFCKTLIYGSKIWPWLRIRGPSSRCIAFARMSSLQRGIWKSGFRLHTKLRLFQAHILPVL